MYVMRRFYVDSVGEKKEEYSIENAQNLRL